MTAQQEQDFRKVAADLVRQWADKRLVVSTASGGKDRVKIGASTREMFENCADDIERGIR